MEKRNKNMMLVATLLLATSITLNAAEEAPSRFAFLQRVPGVAKVAAAATSVRATLADMQNPESYGPRDGRSLTQQGKDAGTAALAGLKKAKNAVVAIPSAAFGGLKSTLSVLWTNLDVTVSAPFVAQQLWNQIPDAYKAMALEHVPSTFPGRDKLALAANYVGSFKASQVATAGLSKGFDWAQWLVRNSWIQRIENAVDGKIFSIIPGLNRVEGPYRKVLSVLTAYVIWTKVVLPYIVRSNRAGQWTEAKLTSLVTFLIAQLPTFGRAAAPAPEQPERAPGQPAPAPEQPERAPGQPNGLLARFRRQPAAPAVSTEKARAEELRALNTLTNVQFHASNDPLVQAIRGVASVEGTQSTIANTGGIFNFKRDAVCAIGKKVVGADKQEWLHFVAGLMIVKRKFSTQFQIGDALIDSAINDELDTVQ